MGNVRGGLPWDGKSEAAVLLDNLISQKLASSSVALKQIYNEYDMSNSMSTNCQVSVLH